MATYRHTTVCAVVVVGVVHGRRRWRDGDATTSCHGDGMDNVYKNYRWSFCLDTSWVDPTQLVQIWEMIHNQESWWQLVRKSTSQRWSYWVYYTHATCNRMIIFQDMRWVFEIYAEWSSSWMREWVSCARGDCDGRCDINFLSPYFLFNSIYNI